MTELTMSITLENYTGEYLELGPDKPCDITKVTGLESTEYDVGLVDFAEAAGSYWTGTRIKPRPIHLEGSFRSAKDRAINRATLISFFKPSGGIQIHVTLGEATLRIVGLLEGWNLKDQKNLDTRIGFVADFICPDPFFMTNVPTRIEAGGTVYAENHGDVPVGWVSQGMTSVEMVGGPHMRVTGAEGTVVMSTQPGDVNIMVDGGNGFKYMDRTSKPFQIPVGGCYIKAVGSGDITYSEKFLGI